MRSGASSWANTVATGWLANKDMPATISIRRLRTPSVLTKAKIVAAEIRSESAMTQEPE